MSEVVTHPGTSRVWELLAGIPDPEIPVISILDLGIVRDVAWDDETLVVTVTPTYSGCPATAIINLDIENALRAKGVSNRKFKRQLAPAWTTDWISEAGRERLRAYGIAPPGHCGDAQQGTPIRILARGIDCPRCGSAQTQRLSAFGSTACKALYRCVACREPFEHFKPI